MKKLLLLITLLPMLTSIAQIDTSRVKNLIKVHDFPFTLIPTPQWQATTVLQQSDTNYRRLYFIHGLGGDASSWQRASDACWDQSLGIPGFPARKVEISRPEYIYSTNTTLNSAAYHVRQQIRNQSLNDIQLYQMNPNRAILIGHSQGGMIIRSLVHMDLLPDANIPVFGKGYGGFVTIASPLQGAKILNNRGMIEEMADDACTQLMKGPGQSNISLQLILKLLGKEMVSTTICDLISNNLLPAFFSQYYDNITNDYMVGAPAIQVFNNDTLYNAYKNMPKIAIYGVEPRENIFWRTANWLIKNPNDVGPFEANEDWEFYHDVVQPTYMQYSANMIHNLNQFHAIQSVQNYVIPYLFPLTYITNHLLMNSYQRKYLAWKAGVDWFNHANENWETIIGAREITTVTDTAYYCRSCNVYPFWTLSSALQPCISKGCRVILPIPITTLQWRIKENDGIVIAESAGNLPGATAIPPRILINDIPKYNGSSHMQIRNDEYLKRSFNKLFDGEYGYFFMTHAKNGQ